MALCNLTTWLTESTSALALILLVLATAWTAAFAQPTLEQSCPKAAPGAATAQPPSYMDYNCYVANIAPVPTMYFRYVQSGCMQKCASYAQEKNVVFWFWEQGMEIGGPYCACYGGGPCNDPKLFQVQCGPVGTPNVGVFTGVNGTTAAVLYPSPTAKKSPPPPKK
jgi:hypothetical protein